MLKSESWKKVLSEHLKLPYLKELANKVVQQSKIIKVYPDSGDIFNAFNTTSYEEVKVLILGQDPYINGEAHGLSFSSKKGFPPSLRNIFKELKDDLEVERGNTVLLDWAKQGVLLLNRVLTVDSGNSNSHRGFGWELFTDEVIRTLNNREDPVIFVLWGRNAQEVQHLITNKHHHVLTAPHPSPFSAHTGFFGCKHFSTINNILKNNGKEPIDW